MELLYSTPLVSGVIDQVTVVRHLDDLAIREEACEGVLFKPLDLSIQDPLVQFGLVLHEVVIVGTVPRRNDPFEATRVRKAGLAVDAMVSIL